MKLGFSPFVGPAGDIYPFDSVFDRAYDLTRHGVEDMDAILLWGGTDINPHYYEDKPHPFNGFNDKSWRDRAEWGWMQDAQAHGVPIIGVCRGAQFICAFAGGKLIQHCTGHGGTHDITVLDNGEERVYQTSSSHHQMMFPYGLPNEEYKILGWSTEKRSKCYDGSSENEQRIPEKECEVVLFPKIRALAIQGHPEWQDKDSAFVKWCLKEVKVLVNKE